MLASGHLDGHLRMWSIRTNELIYEFKDLHEDAITSCTITPDEKAILTNSRDHSLKLIDIRNYKVVCTFEDEHYLNGSATNRATVSSDGSYALVGSKNGNVLVFDLAKQCLEEIYEDEHTTTINAVEWQPRGTRFVSIDSMGALYFWGQ